jgi:hypothetical protein
VQVDQVPVAVERPVLPAHSARQLPGLQQLLRLLRPLLLVLRLLRPLLLFRLLLRRPLLLLTAPPGLAAVDDDDRQPAGQRWQRGA